MSFEEFRQTKPLIFYPSAIVLFVGIVYMVIIGGKTYGSWMENIDYLRQTMAPAFNETTGFLMISYAVILCIGNVIMKTSPKYLTGIDTATQEKTTGFVAWLQSKGLGWLPILISTTVITLMTFLPINNKILKIGIIAIVLCGVLMGALFFNAIIKLFGPKEEFTNVKEEFGHKEEVTGDDGETKKQQHNLKITVKVGDYKKGQYGTHFVDIKNDSGGKTEEDGHNQDWRSADPSHYNGIELGNNATYEPYIDLAYTPHSNYDVYYSNEIATKPGFLTSLKKLTDKTKQIDVTEINEQTYYFHLFPKGIKIFSGQPSKDEIKLGAGYTTNPETGICTLGGEEILAVGDEVFIFPPGGIKYDHKTDKEYRYKFEENEKKEIVRKHMEWPGSGTENDVREIGTPDNVDVILITSTDETLTDTKFSIKNMEIYFGFDVDVVKESVSASYISYYCLVWGSFLVYKIVTNLQQGGGFLSIINPINIPKSLLPFMGAAFVETALIGQSHLSLNESDVASSTGEPSPTFSYAVAGFATRIATVAAFLSNILTQVKD